MPLTPLSSLSGQISIFFSGVPLSLFGGAKPFRSGSGWYISPYPSFPMPLSVQLLLSGGLFLLFTMLLRTHRHSLWLDPISFGFKIFTYFRTILHALSLPARDYACHSFRRGGASFAFRRGLPVEIIKILGASNVVPENLENILGVLSISYLTGYKNTWRTSSIVQVRQRSINCQ